MRNAECGMEIQVPLARAGSGTMGSSTIKSKEHRDLGLGSMAFALTEEAGIRE